MMAPWRVISLGLASVAVLLSVHPSSAWSTSDCTGNADLCTAMTSLYSAGNGASWSYKWAWMTDDPCDGPWYGLGSCDNGEAVELEIDFANFGSETSNHLPTQIGLMTSVTQFKLKKNDCTGTNCLAGTIPTQFGKVTEHDDTTLATHTDSSPPLLRSHACADDHDPLFCLSV